MPPARRASRWWRATRLLSAALVVGAAGAGALLACAAELSGRAVCSGAQLCADGEACVLGRCRPPTDVPAKSGATRLSFDALEWAALRGAAPPSRGAGLEGEAPVALDAGAGDAGDRGASAKSADAPPEGGPSSPAAPVAGDEAIALGRQGDGTGVLLLRFALEIPAEREIELALLVLDPLPHCPRYAGRMDLELAQVLEPWRAGDVSFGRQPALDLPVRAPSVQTALPVPLRLDVTEFVEAWRLDRSRYHGLALISAGTSPGGACYSAGVSAGRGPRIELYLKALPPDAGADAASDAGDDADASLDGDEETEEAPEEPESEAP